jgi:hypothetical protein
MRHVARVEYIRNSFRISVGKYEVLGVDGKIEMDLKELSWQCVNWIYIVWDRHQCRDLVMTKELLASQRASASWCLSFVLDSSQSDVEITNHRQAN